MSIRIRNNSPFAIRIEVDSTFAPIDAQAVRLIPSWKPGKRDWGKLEALLVRHGNLRPGDLGKLTIPRLLAFIEVAADAAHPNTKSAGNTRRRLSDAEVEGLVKQHVADCFKKGVKVGELTRDGIAAEIGVSGDKVSATPTWAKVKAAKDQEKADASPAHAASNAIKRRDWRALESIQRAEQQHRRCER
jgi:hypothetical protein